MSADLVTAARARLEKNKKAIDAFRLAYARVGIFVSPRVIAGMCARTPVDLTVRGRLESPGEEE